MKLLFMGSAAFAVPSLAALVDSPHDILAVVTQPDKPAGRGRHITACPAAIAARSHGLILYQPRSVKKPDVIEHIRKLTPELIVVVAYGKILPKALLDLPLRGCINLHASLLPKYRGAAPINWAIVNGESETGVTTQLIGEELDAGDILLSSSTLIGEEETAPELHDRLAKTGAALLLQTIEGIESGTIKPTPQDHNKATFAPLIKKPDGHIDWTLPARNIFNRIRGLNPWPGTFTTLEGKQLSIHKAAPDDTDHKSAPGTIIGSKGHLVVACGQGSLYLLEVQLEGKRQMTAADFLHGHKVSQGMVLT